MTIESQLSSGINPQTKQEGQYFDGTFKGGVIRCWVQDNKIVYTETLARTLTGDTLMQ